MGLPARRRFEIWAAQSALLISALFAFGCAEDAVPMMADECEPAVNIPNGILGPLGIQEGAATVQTSSVVTLRFDSGGVYQVGTLIEPIPDGTRVYARVELIEGPILGISRVTDIRLAIWTLDAQGPGSLARLLWRGTRFLAGQYGDVSYRAVRTQPAIEECEAPLYRLGLEFNAPGVDLVVEEGCQARAGSYLVSNLRSYQFGAPQGASCADGADSHAHGYIVNSALLTEEP